VNVRRICLLASCLLLLTAAALGDELQGLRELGNTAWHAFEQHQVDDGRRYFEDFLQKVSASERALRDTQIEVIMGVLGCALPEHRAMGHGMLEHVLGNGKGITQIRAALTSIRDACTGSETVEPLPATTWKLTLASASGGIGVSGKGGYLSAKPVPSITVSQIDQATLDKRLQETEDPTNALAATLTRWGSQGTVTDHFIVVVNYSGKVWAEGIAKCLNGYGANLSNEFNMAYPSHRITVYNSGWDDTVYEIASHLHGLQLAPGTIAYSVYGDLSMVGAGTPEACGSLAHELTHLMIKGNFGDAPPWLEEGLASAVALSVASPNHLGFEHGWRDTVLRDKWTLRPSVGKLLSLTWDDFSPNNDNGLDKTAAVQAMASVFVRYLAAKGKLDAVYFAVRNQNLMTDIDHHLVTQQILEQRMGMSATEIDKDFTTWFNKQELPQSMSPTVRPCKPGERPSPMAQEAPCKPPEVMNLPNAPPH